MLGPFRVRNLRPYRAPTLPNTERLSACEAIVSVTGNEYQRNLDTHPDSRLKYIDEDDGETVTIGSSAELAARLREVVPKRMRSKSANYHKSFGKMPSDPARPPTPDMHVFDINRTIDSVRIWQDIEQRCKNAAAKLDECEQRCKDAAAKLDEREPPHSEQADSDMDAHYDPADDAARLQEMREGYTPYPLTASYDEMMKLDEKARRVHFAESNPPQIPSRLGTKAEEDSSARHHKMGDSVMDKASLTLPKAPVTSPSSPPALPFSYGIPGDGKLTAEGQRQAIEAGSRLRMRNNQTWYPPAVLTSGPKPSNRWPSYKPYGMVRSTAADESSEPTNTALHTSDTQALPEPEHGAPLLQMFREELAKIQKPIGKLEIDQAWKTVNYGASDSAPTLDSKSFARPKQSAAPAFHTELVELVDNFVYRVDSIVTDTQLCFTRMIDDTEKSIVFGETINHEALFAILQDFRKRSRKAGVHFRDASSGIAETTERQIDATACQALAKSLHELSNSIDSFANLLPAVVLGSESLEFAPSKNEFPHEPLEIEIENIPSWAGTDQIRSLVLRALSIDGPFSGGPEDILSIRIVAATAGKVTAGKLTSTTKATAAQVKFRSHQVAVHVVANLKNQLFGGQRLRTSVPRELNPRDKGKEKETLRGIPEHRTPLAVAYNDPRYQSKEEESQRGLPVHGTRLAAASNDPLDQRPELTQGVPFSAMPKFRAAMPNEGRDLARAGGNADVTQSTAMKRRTPIIPFPKLPSLQGRRPLSVTAVPGAVNVHRADPAIHFRHAPSPMPGAALRNRRSFQFTRFPSFKSQHDTSSWANGGPSCAPPPHKQFLKPSRTADLVTSFEEQAVKDRAEPYAAKNDEKLEHSTLLANFGMVREGAPQLSKKQPESQAEQRNAEKKDVGPKSPTSDALLKPQPTRSYVYVPSRSRDHPGAWESITDEHANDFRPITVHQDTDSSNRKPVSCHYTQAPVPQAPSVGWTPSSVKQYSGQNANGMNGVSAAPISAPFAPSAMGHSGRGYPEAVDAKNLRHSMSTGAIRKAKAPLFDLSARPDAGRGRPIDQRYRTTSVFFPFPPKDPSSATRKEDFMDFGSVSSVGQTTSTLAANEVDYLTGNTDIAEPLAPSLPVLEQTRFSNMEQTGQGETHGESATSIAAAMTSVSAPMSEKSEEEKLDNEDTTMCRLYSPERWPCFGREVDPWENDDFDFPLLPSMEPLTPVVPKAAEQNNSKGKEQQSLSNEFLTTEPFRLHTAFEGHTVSNTASQKEKASDDLSFREVFESPVSPFASSSSSDAPFTQEFLMSDLFGAPKKPASPGGSPPYEIIDGDGKPLILDAPVKPSSPPYEIIDGDGKPLNLEAPVKPSGTGSSPPYEIIDGDGKPLNLEASAPSLGPRLVQPFDPLAETAAIHHPQPAGSITRSNTVTGHGDHGKARIYRPYPERPRPYSEYLPRIDDDPQRGSFADLTTPSANLDYLKKLSGNGPNSVKAQIHERTEAKKAKAYDSEWPDEKKIAAYMYRETYPEIFAKNQARAASPFMDPRPAPGPPGSTAAASTTSLPLQATAPGVPTNAAASTTSLRGQASWNTNPAQAAFAPTRFAGHFVTDPFGRLITDPSGSWYLSNGVPVPQPFPFFEPESTPQSRLGNYFGMVRDSNTPASKPIGTEHANNTPAFKSIGTERAHGPLTLRVPQPLTKVDKCVEQLRKLGYNREEDGGVERLKIYAQDAEGDVWDAVEMIEGERKALGERGLALE